MESPKIAALFLKIADMSQIYVIPETETAFRRPVRLSGRHLREGMHGTPNLSQCPSTKTQ